jgi:cell surface protein SprA
MTEQLKSASKILIVVAAVAIVKLSAGALENTDVEFPVVENLAQENLVEPQDTVDLPWPNTDEINPHENPGGVSLPLPDNVSYQIEYDPITGQYVVTQTIGDNLQYRNPTMMTLDEYLDQSIQENLSEYWNEIQEEEDEANRAFAPTLKIGGEGFKTIFGSNEIEIRPQGSAELTFGLNISKTDNPRIPENQRRIATFDFDQKIQLNVVGNIGTKMQLNTNYNTEATFDFENQMKLEYTGDEDEIIKKIEAGNVSLPLSGSLITGSQSLFGLKIETQFGRMRNTTVFSQQKGERREITVEGGAQTQTFDIQADNYDANRHYFLSMWFRDQYDVAMEALPVVNSGVNITRIEVWAVNQQANTQDVRNVVAFTDLGEYGSTNPEINNMSPDLPVGQLIDDPDLAVTLQRNPSNLNNEIFGDMVNDPDVMDFTNANSAIAGYGFYQQGVHYERVGNARKLDQSEYTYNSRLGFISLRQALNNAEVLAVAYEYTLNGETYQVGTLSQDGYVAPGALVLKMLKSSITNVASPMWDLMMKNVYNIGAFGVQRDNFRLDVWYNNPSTGVDQNYVEREPLNGRLLIQVLNMDKLDINNMPYSDGVFDYVDNAATQGGLINSQNGRVFLPVVEPFGSHLENEIREGLTNQEEADGVVNSLVFQELYDSTKTAAQQIPSKNRFKLRGQYQSSSSSEIALNALNIPQGSVTVTAGGNRLTEGTDYTVDYNLGRVRIINDGILQSGMPINISLESNSLFNIQTKTLLGSRFDYTVSDNFNLGATVLNLRERPLTQKVNIGDEPVNNTILGLDLNYSTESDWLTRMVDALPFIETKAKSNVSLSAEGAYLIPGHSRAVGKDGNAYLDDFEGSQSTIDIRSINQWFLASTPKLQTGAGDEWPEGNFEDSLIYGYNRAKLSWYVIDPQFWNNALPDGNVGNEAVSDNRMREVLENEVFPNRELPAGTPPNIPTLDLTYYPDERGPYNYELPGGTDHSAGLDENGNLIDPSSRWGGIQRALTTTDFEAANVEFIQFWLMDPFSGGNVDTQGSNQDSQNTTGGELYFNLGNVSEDILNDSQLSFENGLPTTNNPLDTLHSTWGVYPDPSTFNVVNAFDNSTNSYDEQDLGLDGLASIDEIDYFADWIAEINASLSPAGISSIEADPSADDFAYFRSSEAQDADLNILERYKNYNGNEGNADTSTPDGYPITATTIPNTEDINQDLTLNTIESYYQYKVSLRPENLDGDLAVGSNYITDVRKGVVDDLPDGTTRSVNWYQFKIPIKEFTGKFGGITDFRSIRYIRMMMKGWEEEATLRFARLELVRGEWRRYLDSLEGPGEFEPDDPEATTFNLNAVNIEENGNRIPIDYVVPPGITREIDVGTANLRNLNEQSLSLEVCNLQDGDARAGYRNVNFDMRMYENLEMFVHAESAGGFDDLNTDDVTCFIRLGSDFNENYYEYELPLEVTPWGTTADDEIWPESNEMNIELKKLQNLKTERPAGFSLLQEYSKMDGRTRLKVKGNPNLANVVVVMIGIRNPDKDENPFSTDDGNPKCAIVWANELRLTGFNEKGGWAAIASMNATLADFGSIQMAGNMSTPGWGSLEQRVQERQRETIQGFDAGSTLQLGKFFPEQLGVTLPMYLGYSATVSTPQFDPLSPDLELNDLPNLSKERKKKSQNFTQRKSINFTNVSINPSGKGKDKDKGKGDKGGKDPKANKGGKTAPKGGGADKKPFYDVSNFSVSYAYNELYQRDINTEFLINKNYTGAFAYAFNNRPKEIKPFSKIGFIKKSPYLKWIKDFNFIPGIKTLSFRTSMDRTYETSRIRNNTFELFGFESDVLIQTQVMKTWQWTREYNFKYDLTKSISFDFSANNLALVGEPIGVIDKSDTDAYEAYKDTVWANIQNLGETTNYNHNVRLSYKLPFDKFPLIDFISSDVRYDGTYRWDRAPFTQDTLGHTIQNSRNLTLNAQANLVNLYNKVPLLKDLNSKRSKKKKNKGVDKDKVDGFGNETDDEEKEKKERVNPAHVFLRLLMVVRNVNATYTRNEGLLLPGYGGTTQYLGMDQNFEAPGWGFVLGQQNTNLMGDEVYNYALEAAENGWLVQQEFLNSQYNETFNENIQLRANLEPIRDFKIELTANKQSSTNQSSFFRYDADTDSYQFDSPVETGNFSASVITWPTAFIKDQEDFSSDVFDQFLLNRLEISDRLNNVAYQLVDAQENGYYEGWGPTSQEVVIPAFIAAYTGKTAGEVPLDIFDTKVAPNWRVTYDGLSKIPAVKKVFKRFSLNHTYRSTVSTSYVTNLNYEENEEGLPTAVDASEFENFIPFRQVNTVSVSEQFSPLIGFDMTINTDKQNEPQVRVEWKKDRTVGLGLTNYQISETKSNSLVIGVGYTFKEVPNPFVRHRKSRLPLAFLEDTELELRADLTIRDNVTLIRKMVEKQNQVTAGQRLISIKTSADMKVSDKLTLRFFYDHQLTRPKISTSFPTSNINSGLSLRFTLSQ